MMYLIIVTNSHADPDIYRPYPTEESAEAYMTDNLAILWEIAEEGGGVEVVALRPAGGWK